MSTEIITDRLILNSLQETDWPMISYLRSDEQVNTFVERPKAETQKEAIAFIYKIQKYCDTHQSYYWAIRLKEHTDLIGTICLWQFSDDRKTAEIGYDLSPMYQKLGIMQEAIKAIIDFSKEQLKLIKLEAYTHEANIASLKLLKINGFILVPEKKDKDNVNNIIFAKTL